MPGVTVGDGGQDPCTVTGAPVTILSASAHSVSFAARSASKSGAADERLLRTFTVPMSEVRTKPIDGAPAPVAMEPGKTGVLFVTRSALRSARSDGFAPIAADAIQIKHPECAGTPRWLSKLGVLPRTIVIRGQLRGETTFFELDLLGAHAENAQSIHWTSATYIELRLTRSGAKHVGAGTRAMTVEVWPVSIKIHGSPVIDPEVLGEIDVLDAEMADGEQHLELADRGSPVSIWVTQSGCNAFHVTPQHVAEASARPGGPCVGCAKQAAERPRERASRVARRPRGERAGGRAASRATARD